MLKKRVAFNCLKDQSMFPEQCYEMHVSVNIYSYKDTHLSPAPEYKNLTFLIFYFVSKKVMYCHQADELLLQKTPGHILENPSPWCS